MQDTGKRSSLALFGPVSHPVGGVIAGAVAGVAYLAAQVSFAAAAGGGAVEPLQRIAAILMGPDAAPPPSEFSFTILGMATIIHLALAMVFGRVVAWLVWRRPAGSALLLGAAIGVALYAVNFHLLAPLAFPWFEQALQLPTIVDHALFGGVAAAVCLALRRA